MQKIKANQVDTGKLLISTTTHGNALPVGNARVSVFGIDDKGNEVQVEELTTNNSGRTAEIELHTPPLDYSLLPGSPMPYAQYNIKIDSQGFDTLAIKDIQILPDTTAIQNCHLHPEGIAAQQNEMMMIDTPHHTLYYEYPPKYPEDAVKDIPPPTGFVVLDRVVVPETIIVHAGHPDTPAPNYFVPFRDYIKNVASSEIYANWPVDAIKANVLCILSFTLNRIFTITHLLGKLRTKA